MPIVSICPASYILWIEPTEHMRQPRSWLSCQTSLMESVAGDTEFSLDPKNRRSLSTWSSKPWKQNCNNQYVHWQVMVLTRDI
jgi:hypothetical protein